MSIETRKRFPTLLESVARVAGSNQASDPIEVNRFGVANVFLEITGVTGSPSNYTLTVKLQGSLDLTGSTWHDIDIFRSQTSLGFRMKRRLLAGFQRLRVVYTLSFTGGTSPTLTFSVRAQLDQALSTEDVALKGLDVKGEGQYASAQTNQQLVAAPGAGKRIVITDILFSNGATAGKFKLVEDTGGTPVDLTKEFFFPISGGLIRKLPQPIRLTENKNLGITSTTVTTHTIEVHGYEEILT